MSLKLPTFITESGEQPALETPLSQMRPERVKTIWNELQAQASRFPHVEVAIVLDFEADRLMVAWAPKQKVMFR